MTPEEFRRYGHQLIDWLADYHESLAKRPVMARTRPGEMRDALPAAPPDEPEDFGEVIADLDGSSCPDCRFGSIRASSAISRPMRCPPAFLAISSAPGLGVLGLSWQSSPALTEVEEVVTDWLRQMLGLSAAWSGVSRTPPRPARWSRSSARASGRQTMRSPAADCRASRASRCVYVSAHAHSSVDKAALLAGFGRDNLRLVPFDAKFAMRADALAEMVAAGPRQRRPALRHRRHRRHDRDAPRSIRSRPSPRSRDATASGCMSTPRWRAAR